MARLNDDGQWIILMGFVISVGIFFLAILLNQSALVGQTTAESVLEFPKSDIQDLRSEVLVIFWRYDSIGDTASRDASLGDINKIALARKAAVIKVKSDPWIINYNNGVTSYYEVVRNDGWYY